MIVTEKNWLPMQQVLCGQEDNGMDSRAGGLWFKPR